MRVSRSSLTFLWVYQSGISELGFVGLRRIFPRDLMKGSYRGLCRAVYLVLLWCPRPFLMIVGTRFIGFRIRHSTLKL